MVNLLLYVHHRVTTEVKALQQTTGSEPENLGRSLSGTWHSGWEGYIGKRAKLLSNIICKADDVRLSDSQFTPGGSPGKSDKNVAKMLC